MATRDTPSSVSAANEPPLPVTDDAMSSLSAMTEQPVPCNTAPTQRPVFIYGTLCATQLLAWVLTGDQSRTDDITHLICPARVENIARHSLHGRDYPAAVKKPGSSITGYLLRPQTCSQRKKLDDFEGEVYQVIAMEVSLLDDTGEVAEAGIEADMYLWNGGEELVSDQAWDLQWFIRERLEDWLDLFEGMEMIGDDGD